MKVLVTGANGHIGSNLLPILLEQGHEVVPFVRENADTQGIDEFGLEYARGDVLDKDSLVRAAEGCDAIIHLAAVYSMSNDPVEVMEPALAGAKNVIAAARQHGIGRLVYTSSIVSIGTSRKPEILGVDHWADDAVLPYAIAKRDSERLTAQLAREAGIEIIIVNPTAIIGPGDFRVTPSNQSIRDWVTGRSQTPLGGNSFVDVRDVALAHARGLQHGQVGERHILCARNESYRAWGRMVRELCGKGPMHLPVPRFILLPFVFLAERFLAIVGVKLPFTYSQAKEFAGRYAWYDGSSGADLMGRDYSPIRESVRQSILWLIQREQLSAKLVPRLEAAAPTPELDTPP